MSHARPLLQTRDRRGPRPTCARAGLCGFSHAGQARAPATHRARDRCAGPALCRGNPGRPRPRPPRPPCATATPRATHAATRRWSRVIDTNQSLLPGEHAQRRTLSNEVHARPFVPLQPPIRATHLALLTGEHGAEADRASLARLCARYGVEPPEAGVNHVILDFGDFRLRWERHTEFCSYTVFVAGPLPDDPFSEPALEALPRDWLASLPDSLLVAVNLALNERGEAARDLRDMSGLMDSANFAGASVAGDNAYAFVNFAIDANGFGRIFVQDRGLGRYQAGRLTQRLLEIETYRMLALLALPVARSQGSELSHIQTRLAAITTEMNDLESLDDERRMLRELTGLAQAIEAIAASTQYRFGAANAYYGLVQRRITELREERIPGFQTLAEFIDRRLAPAMGTCEAVDQRRSRLAGDLARAVDLLHTRVNVRVEAQNRDLLASMDRRSDLQVRLQETVEGLSVAAITYYAVSLVGYAARAMEQGGLAVNTGVVTGVSIPLVAGGVWYIIRRVRRHIQRRAGSTA